MECSWCGTRSLFPGTTCCLCRRTPSSHYIINSISSNRQSGPGSGAYNILPTTGRINTALAKRFSSSTRNLCTFYTTNSSAHSVWFFASFLVLRLNLVFSVRCLHIHKSVIFQCKPCFWFSHSDNLDILTCNGNHMYFYGKISTFLFVDTVCTVILNFLTVWYFKNLWCLHDNNFNYYIYHLVKSS